MSTARSGNGGRFAARPLIDGGTSASEWREWDREFPSLDLDGCPALVLVAPHPDDETLGFGATASALKSRGVPVSIVSVTDGGRAFPDLSRLERTWLEADRRAEVSLAAKMLGLDPPTFLSLPDGELASREEELTDRIADVLAAGPRGVWCAATWRGDGHPDHEAVGRGAAGAVDRTGATLLEYPVWMWHWACPNDVAVPWDRMRVAPPDRAAMARKRRATTSFQTQVTPREAGMDAALPPLVIQRLFAVGEAAFC